jgi:hypothetical protein
MSSVTCLFYSTYEFYTTPSYKVQQRKVVRMKMFEAGMHPLWSSRVDGGDSVCLARTLASALPISFTRHLSNQDIILQQHPHFRGVRSCDINGKLQIFDVAPKISVRGAQQGKKISHTMAGILIQSRPLVLVHARPHAEILFFQPFRFPLE